MAKEIGYYWDLCRELAKRELALALEVEEEKHNRTHVSQWMKISRRTILLRLKIGALSRRKDIRDTAMETTDSIRARLWEKHFPNSTGPTFAEKVRAYRRNGGITPTPAPVVKFELPEDSCEAVCADAAAASEVC